MSAIIEGPTLSTRSTVCVLGLGYIGLPTATMFAIRGHPVVGVDPNPRIRTSLGDGSVRSDEPDLAGLVRAALESGRFQVQAEPEPADAFIIAVPTPFDPMTSRANLRYVEQAALDLLPHLRPGNLVILESTVPPGTTR